MKRKRYYDYLAENIGLLGTVKRLPMAERAMVQFTYYFKTNMLIPDQSIAIMPPA